MVIKRQVYIRTLAILFDSCVPDPAGLVVWYICILRLHVRLTCLDHEFIFGGANTETSALPHNLVGRQGIEPQFLPYQGSVLTVKPSANGYFMILRPRYTAIKANKPRKAHLYLNFS